MEGRIDLDEAAQQIEDRRLRWAERGITAGPSTWRERGEGWPLKLKTDRNAAVDTDSVGVTLSKGTQEGSVVLFVGGWADVLYADGSSDRPPIYEAPGYEDWLDPDRFGEVLDRLADRFS